MTIRNCCVKKNDQEGSLDKGNKIYIFHEFQLDSTIFRWSRCDHCGEVFLDEIDLNKEK